METFSALPALCVVTGHRWILLTKASDAELWYYLWFVPWIYGLVNKWGWWFETPSRSIWRHCNVSCIAFLLHNRHRHHHRHNHHHHHYHHHTRYRHKQQQNSSASLTEHVALVVIPGTTILLSLKWVVATDSTSRFSFVIVINNNNFRLRHQ